MDGTEVTHPRAGVAVVGVRGEHDLLNRDELAKTLAEEVADNDLVVIDVSEASFVDASFLYNLVRADRAARVRGSRFVLQMGTEPIVRRLLEVSGLLDTLEFANSGQNATAAQTSRKPLATIQ